MDATNTKILLLILISITLSSCAVVHQYDAYYGKVIDAETKEPLEGVAVLAAYYTEQYGPAGSVSHYVDAKETVTDKSGEFKIPSFITFAFRPLQSFEPHAWFTIFKPGYGCYPTNKRVKPANLRNGILPINTNVVIELPKLLTTKALEQNLLDVIIDYEIPYAKQKLLFDLRNYEAIQMGKEAWPRPAKR